MNQEDLHKKSESTPDIDTPEYYEVKLVEAKNKLAKLEEHKREQFEKGYGVDEGEIRATELRIGLFQNKIFIAQKLEEIEAERDALYKKLENVSGDTNDEKHIEQDIRIAEEIISYLKNVRDNEMFVRHGLRYIDDKGTEPDFVKGILDSIEGIRSRMSWKK